MPDASLLTALHEATRRLIRSVDALSDAEFAAPSLLPDWTRGHVIAHVALNAEALAGVLRGLASSPSGGPAGGSPGADVTMYPTAESRDADIGALATVPPEQLRDRFLASCTRFQDALDQTPPTAWAGRFRRTPGADPWPAEEIPAMRRREVEIHHADLGTGYGPADWPESFVDATFNRVVHDRENGPSMLLRTPDGDVPLGVPGGPVVTGSRLDLTWWLLGRGTGEGLTGDPAVPTLGPWR